MAARLSPAATLVNRPRYFPHWLFRALALLAHPAGAQVDSVRGSLARVETPDSLRPPITPGRAFLRSMLLPGSSQGILGRNKVGAGIIAVEVISIAMIRESGFGVREARRQLGDSLVISYVDANGASLPTPLLQRRRFGEEEVRSRRSHVEDWVALLIANHL